ncbi:MAG: 30S ribosomal protein S7 [Elusimicrobia bacterium RIFOXYD2_FULL_34_15]|nr:MAG: 30S ribosomal protein S7 [Elusimicrobia bacterium RIFOXYD2_FULL_34_15]
MPRKPRKIKKAAPKTDYKYNSIVIARMVNDMLKQGKRSCSESICYGAMDIIKEKTKQEPMTVLDRAIKNIRPLLEVKPRRVGGATYQIPIEVKSARGIALAIRWLLTYAKARKGQPMSQRLAAEIIDASNNVGSAVKKREDTHKMAEANKAFAHYKW